jgi:hypothetical protein
MEILGEMLARLIGPLVALASQTALVVGLGFVLFEFLNSDFLKGGLVWLVKRLDLFFSGPRHRA